MLHRIFLALNLSLKIRRELLGYKERWPELPARWTVLDNLHITLIFLGNTSDKELKDIQRITKEIAARHSFFSCFLSKIVYGPNEKLPRMVWATGEQSTKLTALQQDLANALSQKEENPFSLHITLARLKEWEFRKIEPEERPVINEEISLEVPVSSLEIMESKMKRGRAEYSIIESIPLSS